MGSSANNHFNTLSVNVMQNDTFQPRPPSLGLPDEDEYHTSLLSPSIWTEEHAALLKGKSPPQGISLRAFEEWYRQKLQAADATSAWSPSKSRGYSAMIDLWIRISINKKPSPCIQYFVRLPSSPPRIVSLYE